MSCSSSIDAILPDTSAPEDMMETIYPSLVDPLLNACDGMVVIYCLPIAALITFGQSGSGMTYSLVSGGQNSSFLYMLVEKLLEDTQSVG